MWLWYFLIILTYYFYEHPKQMLNFQPTNNLWLLERTVSMRRFFWAPKTNVKIDGWENIHNFTLNYFCLSRHLHDSVWEKSKIRLRLYAPWDGSFEHPKRMLKLMDEKIFTILRWIIFAYLGLCMILLCAERSLKSGCTFKLSDYQLMRIVPVEHTAKKNSQTVRMCRVFWVLDGHRCNSMLCCVIILHLV